MNDNEEKLLPSSVMIGKLPNKRFYYSFVTLKHDEPHELNDIDELREFIIRVRDDAYKKRERPIYTLMKSITKNDFNGIYAMVIGFREFLINFE